MKREELEAFAREAAKSLKTEKDLNDFSRMLSKIIVEAALNAELEEHLRYSKHEKHNWGVTIIGTKRYSKPNCPLAMDTLCDTQAIGCL
ncbi:hypothetical protein [Legionella sainthelensi]|uniref:hypothetical protein n=1 Tax=Legionella sainthelensi TaxID=28087 RepID=UPI001C6FC6D9